MPKEIKKLRKLRHLLTDYKSSIQSKDIGDMTSLQEIPPVVIDDDRVVVRAVGKLKQLRELRVRDYREKDEKTLCSLINEMQFLEKLCIRANESEVIDLYNTSPVSTLLSLILFGTLERLPNWIPQFQNVLQLHLGSSKLTNDPLDSLKDMPQLMLLCFKDNAYEDETSHFQCGGFQKLKELKFVCLNRLKCILIDRGALSSLETFVLGNLSKLKTMPTGIQHLEKLKDLFVENMPTEFEQRIAPNGGKNHWIIQHVPVVSIWNKNTHQYLNRMERSHLLKS